MSRLTQRQALYIIGGVLTFAAGGTSGYFFANKRLKTKYEELAIKEIEDAKKFYSTLHKREAYETPESAVEELGLEPEVKDAVEAMIVYKGTPTPEPEKIVIEELEVVTNVFNSAKEGTTEFDFEVELPLRRADKPYIITEEEFLENEIEREQVSLTYYEGDDVLVDDKERVIPDVESLIGEDNLQRFGHGTRDHKMLYVRNEVKDLDFEIVRHRGKYTQIVLGMLEHSDKGKRRKFHMDLDE